MAKRPIESKIEDQYLAGRGTFDNLETVPEQPGRFFTNNFLGRGYAYLMGIASGKWRQLAATSAGVLKVAPTGSGYEHQDVKVGTAPDAYAAAIPFDAVCSTVTVFTWDNACLIKRTPDGVVWEDEFEVPANFLYSFDCVTHSFNIKNKTPGSNCRYSIVGSY